MDKEVKLTKIKEIKRLEEAKGEPYRKVKRKALRKQLLENLEKDPEFVGDYVLTESGTEPSYLQIYTEESWEKAQEYLERSN